MAVRSWKTAISVEADADIRGEHAMIKSAKLITLTVLTIIAGGAAAREYLPLPPEMAGRSYSPAVVTKGGKIVWLAGVTTLKDEDGKSLVGDVEGQTRFIFREIGRNLGKVGGKLQDIVTMTVYLTDVRHGADFAKVRKEVFPTNAPSSAQVTVSALAVPGFLVEVQAIAVIGDE
jgi:2-iminobutanoate/2-iminopropanoate deaminase